MSIITFWNDSREQTGQTLTTVAVATRMAIERNIKILLISTSINDSTMKKCYWDQGNVKNSGLFGPRTSTMAVENGIEGLFKLIKSNKLTPTMITDYTKVVFRGRLEVITGITNSQTSEQENLEYLNRTAEDYIELIKRANQYYDIVIVDLDKRLNAKVKKDILNVSDVNVLVLLQKMESLNRYNEIRHGNDEFERYKCIPVVGKYFKDYKYNSKNIARYLQQKKEIDVLPFNLLYMEASEEAKVVDLFLRLKNVKDKTDENTIFMERTLELTNNILRKLQELQMRMR